MKREDLTKLGLAEDVIDKIMGLHGSDIEGHKAKQTSTATELEGIKAQLLEAGKQIEAFKGMNVDQIKASADEWKAKAEQAAADGAAQVAALRFDHALEGALSGAKAKNSKAVKALLDNGSLKMNEDGSILGLKEQLEKIKSENDYLFNDVAPTPKIVTGGNNQSVIGDAVVIAARKAAGLS
jgi:hypothetical protein